MLEVMMNELEDRAPAVASELTPESFAEFQE